ncbi:hypothetical protein [Candidatus Entotheonella palauensis]|nr:hypothetical protein [Candidatus Entotheonella palauensis]
MKVGHIWEARSRALAVQLWGLGIPVYAESTSGQHGHHRPKRWWRAGDD